MCFSSTFRLIDLLPVLSQFMATIGETLKERERESHDNVEAGQVIESQRVILKGI